MKVKELLARLGRAPKEAEVVIAGLRQNKTALEAYPKRYYTQSGKWLATEFVIEPAPSPIELGEVPQWDFGQALQLLKQGNKLRRRGWNGKGMFIFLREGRQIKGVDPSTPMGGDFESLPHLCMRTADGKCCVGWLASQTDMLSEDWELVQD